MFAKNIYEKFLPVCKYTLPFSLGESNNSQFFRPYNVRINKPVNRWKKTFETQPLKLCTVLSDAQKRNAWQKTYRYFSSISYPLLHKFPSASRYHGRNEVWDDPWFSSLWCFLRSVSVSFSRSCDIKMDGKKREGAKCTEEKKRIKRDEAWMVLTTWKFIATGEKWWTVIHSVFERIRVSSVFSFTGVEGRENTWTWIYASILRIW